MSTIQISRRMLRRIHAQRGQAQGCKGKRKALPTNRLLRRIRAAQIIARAAQRRGTDF
ncbi:TPA: hypothetical protein L4936_001533 [Pseudomonas aeruginosa]|nr:hypothetical protein MRCP2_p1340 [Pseudomonas alcaligenes]HBO6962807.1 hypothetical protein [Pseudomonas aeruginosa]HBO7218588.1 hypothetical protein [Pseudomonas aeruginosa]